MCFQEPGSAFRPGRHHIRYVASDSSGNQASCQFSVTVRHGDEQEPVSKVERNFFKKLIVCPHLVAEAELMPSYLVSNHYL